MRENLRGRYDCINTLTNRHYFWASQLPQDNIVSQVI